MLDSIFKAIYLIGLIGESVIRLQYAKQQTRVVDDRARRLHNLLMMFSFMGMIVIGK